MKKFIVLFGCILLVIAAVSFTRPDNVNAYICEDPFDPMCYEDPCFMFPDLCEPPVSTPTSTPIPPTPTSTSIPPTPTSTSVPPTATSLPIDPTSTSMSPTSTSAPTKDVATAAPKDKGPANGSWVAKSDGAGGGEISTAKVSSVLPNEWSTLLSNGFAVNGRTQVCHPFGGAQYGWQVSIYLQEGNSWIELPTTVEWYPDEEGQLMACAYAPVSGIYAMFGYME